MKIKEEQLETIREQQKDINNTLNNIGYLETQKHGLLHQLAEINSKVDAFKVELENEYGAVEINLESGECTTIESKELVADHV